MRHLFEPTQVELRAWSNGRQALGAERYEELETPISVVACIGRTTRYISEGGVDETFKASSGSVLRIRNA